MSPAKKISLTFVINGVDEKVSNINVNEPLTAARNKALAQSSNTGRPVDEWEVHLEDGTPLDSDKKISELGLEDGTRLFLNLKVGAGGTA